VQMARQVARLMVEAKQQVQNTVRETANRAVAAETRPLLDALQSQLKDAAEKSVEAAVAAHMERMQREVSNGWKANGPRAWLRCAPNGRANGIASSPTPACKSIPSSWKWNEGAGAISTKKLKQLQVAIEKLQSLSGNMGANASQVRAAIEQTRRSSEEAVAGELQRWQQLMDQRTAEAQARFAQLEEATRSLGDRIATEASNAESGWRGLLEADLAAASRRWNEKIEASLEEAARRIADRVVQASDASTLQLDDQLQHRVGMISSAFSQVTAEAERTLGTLRASISNEIASGQATISQLQHSLEQFENAQGRNRADYRDCIARAGATRRKAA